MACRSILCAASATTVSFLCEKEEAIESITAVTITPPLFSPNCSTLATYTSTSTCDVTATTALLQSSCVGKAECTVDVSSVLASACPDVLTGGVELTASVKCHLPGGLDTLTLLILVLYFWINLGLGATLTPDIFLEIWRNKKRAFAIGWLSQFGFMPIMSFALSHAFGLEPLRAIGAVLCGMAPGGLTSNLLVYWVDGNVALSITMSCASSVCCMFMIPLLYMLLIRTSFAAGTDISLPFDAILMPLAFAVVGVIIGVGIKVFNKEKQCGPSWRKMHYHRWTAKCGSLIGLLFLIAAFITGVRRDPELLVPSDFSREWALAAIFQPLGGLFGFVLAKLARLDMADCRAVCLETGVQSYPLVLALVGLTWTGCERIQIVAFPIIATFWYLWSTAWMIPVIQVATVPDSCIERLCWRKPPILSNKLPLVHSVVGSDGQPSPPAADPSKPRQLAPGKIPTEGRFGKEVDNCYSLFARAAGLYAKNPCLGWRPVLNASTGKLGKFKFLTFEETHARVLNLASGIAPLELPRGSTFGMYASNCLPFQVVTLGMMSQGHTCVPIYDTLGEDIVQYEANHADMPIMFVEANKLQKVANVLKDCKKLQYVVALPSGEPVSADLKAAFAAADVKLLEYDEVLKAGAAKPVEPKPASGEDLAFIMYTSGTTGDPKGVCIKQISITIGSSYCAGIQLFPTDRYLSFLPLAHIFETMVEHAILATGGSVGFFNGNIRKLADDIAALKPTLFVGVPRVYQRFYEMAEKKIAILPGCFRSILHAALVNEMKHVSGAGGKRTAWGKILVPMIGKAVTGGSVRLMISGAAPLPLHVHEFLVAAIGCDVIQGYGMTENCANCTIMLPGDNRAGLVGPPMPTVEVKLVDVPEMSYTASENCSGEVVMRGAVNFVGYHKNKEETDKVLTVDGWLHTGDIGRWNPDGTLSIIDRKKNIFKLSQGEYIAAEKIEMIISKSKYISQPWVYGNSNFSCLVAVVTPDYAELKAAAKAGGWASDDMAELAAKPEAIKLILDEIASEAKAGKLKTFEVPKAVHLEAVTNELGQGFSVENDLLTPTFKVKRPQLLQKYQQTVNQMYTKLGEKVVG